MIQLTEATFSQEVLQAKEVVLVDFWAAWCGPCKLMEPVVEALAKDLEGKAKIAKMNVDENQSTPGGLGIMSIPTFLVFKDGKVVEQVVGSVSKEELLQKIEKHF
ncbi:MAG: thioredoxin [bacterium]|nr:thioredoxin [bacterium]